METTTIRTTSSSGRQAAVNGLAIVGFIVLLIIGMALAIYAATFVPKAISGIGSAAVYFSSAFRGAEDSNLEVVPETETVPFGDDSLVVGTTTPATTTPPTTPPTQTPGTTPTPTPGPVTTTTYTVGGTAPVAPHGLPDLVIENVTTGYLRTSDTSSFVASDEVPDGERGAVKFTIANRGTNVSGRFEFEAELPTSRAYTFSSRAQQSLNPGERIDYVLGFDRTRAGENRTITITVDPDKDVRESNENNNERSVRVDIED